MEALSGPAVAPPVNGQTSTAAQGPKLAQTVARSMSAFESLDDKINK